jgi:hypothetical protein
MLISGPFFWLRTWDSNWELIPESLERREV